MKARLLILALLMGSLGISHAQGSFPRVSNDTFKAGETLDYSLLFKWGAVNTEVASARFMVDSVTYCCQPAYHSVLSVKSAPFFDVFFKMREKFEGWMEPVTIRPLKFIRDTHEGSYWATNLYKYDWKGMVIHADVNSSNMEAPMHLELPLGSEGVVDIGSILYYSRGMDTSRLKPGQKFPLHFAVDDDIFDVVLTYRGKDTVKRRRLGTVRCLKFSCTVQAGTMFEGSEEFLIWVSDDINHLPVSFMAPLRVGSVYGWLKGWSGLKYDFDALAR